MAHLLTLHDPAAAREHYLSGVWQTDTMYSLAESITLKADWGHSSNVMAVNLCHGAGARKLVLFHHEPATNDATLEGLLKEARRFEELTRGDQALKVSAAYDGLEIDL